MNILLAAATGAEIAPFIEYIQAGWKEAEQGIYHKDRHTLTISLTGVGMMATAYHLTKALSKSRFDLAIQAGIGGAFDRGISLGDVVCVASEQLGDLGAEDGDNYLDIFDMGLLQIDQFPFAAGSLDMPETQFHKAIQLPRVRGLTVNMVTGKEASVQRLADTYGCQVESMEGAAFHYVCLNEQVYFAQIRAISNYVERRNRDAWNIKDAVINLNNWLISFAGQL